MSTRDSLTNRVEQPVPQAGGRDTYQQLLCTCWGHLLVVPCLCICVNTHWISPVDGAVTSVRHTVLLERGASVDGGGCMQRAAVVGVLTAQALAIDWPGAIIPAQD